MLDFLVPDELRCLQWLVSGALMEEKSPAGVNFSNRPRNLRLPGKHSGSKELENMAKKVLSRIVPALSRSTNADTYFDLAYVFAFF